MIRKDRSSRGGGVAMAYDAVRADFRNFSSRGCGEVTLRDFSVLVKLGVLKTTPDLYMIPPTKL